jgi:hypothetical protein
MIEPARRPPTVANGNPAGRFHGRTAIFGRALALARAGYDLMSRVPNDRSRSFATGRASSKSGHVRHVAESGGKFRALEIQRRAIICFSPYLYRARNLIEWFFNKIKQCRRVATRYEKLAPNYRASSNSHQCRDGAVM